MSLMSPSDASLTAFSGSDTQADIQSWAQGIQGRFMQNQHRRQGCALLMPQAMHVHFSTWLQNTAQRHYSELLEGKSTYTGIYYHTASGCFMPSFCDRAAALSFLREMKEIAGITNNENIHMLMLERLSGRAKGTPANVIS